MSGVWCTGAVRTVSTLHQALRSLPAARHTITCDICGADCTVH